MELLSNSSLIKKRRVKEKIEKLEKITLQNEELKKKKEIMKKKTQEEPVPKKTNNFESTIKKRATWNTTINNSTSQNKKEIDVKGDVQQKKNLFEKLTRSATQINTMVNNILQNEKHEVIKKSDSSTIFISDKQIYSVSLKNFENGIPKIIEKLILYVENECLETGGLFRIPGHLRSMNRMKDLINKGEDKVEKILEICESSKHHSICGLLKWFIKELPEPIIPDKEIVNYINIMKESSESKRLEDIKNKIKELPVENYNVLYRYSLMFTKITDSKSTMLNPTTLGMVFGANLTTRGWEFLEKNMKSLNSIVSIMISDFLNIFETNMIKKNEKEGVFGKEINKETPIPTVIENLIGYVEKECLGTEGLFRIPGHIKSMNNMKQLINNGETDIEKILEICESSKHHSICGILKWFIKDLPDPIIPDDKLDEFLKESKVTEEGNGIEKFKLILHDLPNENYVVLKRYILMFTKITESKETLLTPVTLGMVFGANLTNRNFDYLEKYISDLNSIITLLILNFEFLFIS
jgi:ferritin